MSDREKAQAAIARIGPLFEKTNIENPKPEDVQLLREALDADPQLLYTVSNLAESAASLLIDRIPGTALTKEAA